MTFNQIDSCRLALSDFLELFEHVPEWYADVQKMAAFSSACNEADATATRHINNLFAESGSLLSTDNLSASFLSTRVTFPDLSIAAGDECRVLIHAPSGSGKTTCFKILRGAIADDYTVSGKLRWGVAYERVCFVPQFPFIDRWTDFHSYIKDIPQDHIVRLQLEQLTARVDKSRWVQELSGGEKARLALLHALAQKPEFLVLDETTSSLDRENVDAVLAILKRSSVPFILFCTDEFRSPVFTHSCELAVTTGTLSLPDRPLVGNCFEEQAVKQFAQHQMKMVLPHGFDGRMYLAGGCFKTLVHGKPPADLDLWPASSDDRDKLMQALQEQGSTLIEHGEFNSTFASSQQIRIEVTVKCFASLEACVSEFDLALSCVGAEYTGCEIVDVRVSPEAKSGMQAREVRLVQNWYKHAYNLRTLDRLQRYATELPSFSVPASELRTVWQTYVDEQEPIARARMLKNADLNESQVPSYVQELVELADAHNLSS
eukprot:COSAG02_NODE_736_length_17865_cov_9.190420_10_plen_488_part_00